MAELPARIRVGPFVYRVVCDAEAFHGLATDPDTYGETHHKITAIYLNPRLDGGAQRETLLHEVKHAVARTVGWMDDERLCEEQAIERVTPMELAVLRDNPALVRFLLADDDDAFD